jgi:hypothetical protein
MKRNIRTFVTAVALAVPLAAAGSILGRNVDRESFLVKVVNGKQVVTETLPPAGK